MTTTDLYELLGVRRDATDEELKRAYRAKARELHPDTGSAESDEQFKEVSLAYEVLKDPERRARYDRYGAEGVFGPAAGQAGDPFAGGLGDLFDAFFNGMGGMGGMGGAAGRRRSGPVPGPDAEIIVQLEFREAVFGVERQVDVRAPVHCDTCEGSGAQPGTSPVRCSECQGAGEVRRVRQSILGQVITASPCTRCQGTGQYVEHPCADCRGEGRRTEDRTLTVDIPAGVDDGSTLRLAGHGPAGFRGGPNGSLFVHVAVTPDDVFERAGVDLHAELHVPMTLAALGGSVDFETLDDSREIAVAAGTQSGTVTQIKGHGVPRIKGRGRGDLFVHLMVDTPTDLDEAQRELLAGLADARGEELGSAPHGEGIFSRLRSALS